MRSKKSSQPEEIREKKRRFLYLKTQRGEEFSLPERQGQRRFLALRMEEGSHPEEKMSKKLRPKVNQKFHFLGGVMSKERKC